MIDCRVAISSVSPMERQLARRRCLVKLLPALPSPADHQRLDAEASGRTNAFDFDQPGKIAGSIAAPERSR